MNDQLAASLSVLISAVATSLLMFASYHWGPQRREDRRELREARRQRSTHPREDTTTSRQRDQWDADDMNEEEV